MSNRSRPDRRRGPRTPRWHRDGRSAPSRPGRHRRGPRAPRPAPGPRRPRRARRPRPTRVLGRRGRVGAGQGRVRRGRPASGPGAAEQVPAAAVVELQTSPAGQPLPEWPRRRRRTSRPRRFVPSSPRRSRRPPHSPRSGRRRRTLAGGARREHGGGALQALPGGPAGGARGGALVVGEARLARAGAAAGVERIVAVGGGQAAHADAGRHVAAAPGAQWESSRHATQVPATPAATPQRPVAHSPSAWQARQECVVASHTGAAGRQCAASRQATHTPSSGARHQGVGSWQAPLSPAVHSTHWPARAPTAAQTAARAAHSPLSAQGRQVRAVASQTGLDASRQWSSEAHATHRPVAPSQKAPGHSRSAWQVGRSRRPRRRRASPPGTRSWPRTPGTRRRRRRRASPEGRRPRRGRSRSPRGR
jgi:hypothetical protein